MAPPPLDATTIRTIIREELAPVEERLAERLVGVEGQLGKVEEELEAVRRHLASLRDELVGLIDERFPPIDQQRTGGAARGFRMAAKQTGP